MAASVFVAIAVLVTAAGAATAQALPRTDTPRAGTLRVTFDPLITTWDREFVSGDRLPIGSSLPVPVSVRAERRVTPLVVEFGITDRVSLAARLPLVRVRTRESADSAARATLDSLLADTTYAFAPLANTRRRRRFWPGDAEVEAKYRMVESAALRVSGSLIVRLPTGHQDSPHYLFDLSAGDGQLDVEARITEELIVLRRLWLNAALRVGRQQPGTRERRVGPHATLLVPRAATALLDWDPGDYAALDVAPLYRFSPHFGAGFTAGYWTKRRDSYAYRSMQDSVDVATRLGAPVPAAVLDAGTSQRWVRLGVALSYIGPDVEGGFSIEQTVDARGGRVPATTVFRIVLRTSRWPF
jgi:hypothetical protein